MHDSPSCVCVKARRAAPAGMLCTCSHKQGSPRPSRRAGPVPSPQRPCRALVPQGADSRTHSAASQSACAAHPGSPAPRRPQRPPGRSPRPRRRPRAPRRGPPSPPRARPPSPPRSCPAGYTPARRRLWVAVRRGSGSTLHPGTTGCSPGTTGRSQVEQQVKRLERRVTAFGCGTSCAVRSATPGASRMHVGAAARLSDLAPGSAEAAGSATSASVPRPPVRSLPRAG